MEAKTTCIAVQNTVRKTLLNRYRENGTHRSDVIFFNWIKFSKVGRRTKKRGGKINSSSKGFSDWRIVYKSGSAMIKPNKSRKMIIAAVPPAERLTCFAYVLLTISFLRYSLLIILDTRFLVMIIVTNSTVAMAQA